jgi:hypothetical protein
MDAKVAALQVAVDALERGARDAAAELASLREAQRAQEDVRLGASPACA